MVDREVYDSYEEAEVAAYDLWSDFEDFGMTKERTVQVGKITEDNLADKDDWFSYREYEDVLVLNDDQ